MNLKKYFDYVLVYFYSPTCHSCVQFKETFGLISEKLSHFKNDLPIVQFDCNNKTLQNFCTLTEKIKHLPKLVIYHHNQKVEYKGPLRKKEIIRWVKQRTALSLKTLNEPDLTKFNKLLEKE